MRAIIFAATIILFVCSAFGAIACEGMVDKFDNRIKVSGDGSFENANLAGVGDLSQTYPAAERFPISYFGEGEFDAASGHAIQDRGNGRVAQLVAFSTYACSGTEAILFVDCEAAKSLLIFGELSPEELRGGGIAGFIWPTIKNIQPPHGPISVTETSTVDSLAKTARRHKIGYLIDAKRVFSGVRKRDAYDTRLGCKLFYPDSAGAQN
jgi:hypothetical protein